MGGEASIYYDGSYVGNTSLLPGGTEDTIQLSLGIDKNIAIKRQKIKEKCSQKVLDNDILHQYTYEITMKNSRATKIDIEVDDEGNNISKVITDGEHNVYIQLIGLI